MKNRTCVRLVLPSRLVLCLLALFVTLLAGVVLTLVLISLLTGRWESDCPRFPDTGAAAVEYEKSYLTAAASGSTNERMTASAAALRLAESFDRVLKSRDMPSGRSWGITAEKFQLASIQAADLRDHSLSFDVLDSNHVYLMWAADRVASGGWCE